MGSRDSYQLLVNCLRASPGATIFLGAGCSLSSAKREVITTEGLIKAFNAEFGGPEAIGSTSYEVFVNLKTRMGDRQAVDFFRGRLEGLEPSPGYKALARLVEAGIFRQIFTTNFDTLLDSVLAPLAPVKIGGDSAARTVPDKPVLMKVHGDINGGLLRFTPEELRRLPEDVARLITDLTQAVTVVVGYRGQDLGVMDSLCRRPDYNAFWAAYDEMLIEDPYTFGPVFDWLRSRKSEANILSGPQHADFDRLMEALCEDVLDRSRPAFPVPRPGTADDPTDFGPWAETAVLRRIDAHPRLAMVFRLLRAYGRDTVARMAGPWRNAAPFFAPSSDALLNAFTHYLRPGELPAELFADIDTEADALLLAVAIDLTTALAGTSLSPGGLIGALREDYDRFCKGYVLPESFWDALIELVDPAMARRAEATVSLFLNNRQRLSLVVERVPLEKMRRLMAVLRFLSLLFLGPAGAPEDSTERKLRSLLAKTSKVGNDGAQVVVQLGDVPEELFSALCDGPLAQFKGGGRRPGEPIFVADDIRVACERLIAPPIHQTRAAVDLFAHVEELSRRQCRRLSEFARGFGDPEAKPVSLDIDALLRGFLADAKPGCLIVGSSGSGKTTALRSLIEDPDFLDRHLPLIAIPRAQLASTPGLPLFLPAELVSERPAVQTLHEIVDTCRRRSRTVVLIVDGLNEIAADVATLVRHYEALLDLCDELDGGKLIITCRDATFEAFLWHNRRPDPSLFFGTETEAILRVASLSFDQQMALIDAYFPPEAAQVFKDRFSSNGTLARQFTHPYLIAVAAMACTSPQDAREVTSAGAVLAKFADTMLARLQPQAVSDTARDLLDSLVSLTLAAGRQQWSVGRRQLIESLPGTRRADAITALAHLRDVNVLHLAEEADRIHFVHERMAEFIVGRHLYRADRSPLEIIGSASRLDPVLIGALRQCYEQMGRDADIGRNAERLGTDVTQLLRWPEETAGALALAVANCDPKPAVLLHRASTRANQPWLAGALLLRGANAALDRVSALPLQSLAEWLADGVLPLSAAGRAEALLLASRAALARTELVQAEEFARQASAFSPSDAALSLADRISVQQAVILRDRGQIAEAIRLLTDAFASQQRHGARQQAVMTALELGMALRDDTRFDDALEIYDRIDPDVREMGTAVRARWANQRSVVEKNVVQKLVRDGAAGWVERVKLDEWARRALMHMDEAAALAEDVGDAMLLLEIASERAELHLVLFAFDGVPERRAQAEAAMKDLERHLSYLPDPTISVEHCRHRARLYELDGDLGRAWAELDRGAAIASARKLTFAVTDCDYQKVRIACLHRVKAPELIKDGLSAAERAIAYYRENGSSASAYLANVETWRNCLRDA